ncbi:4-hydroxyphenylacetate 3-monooxygenase oxygenase component [Raoultella terrigena]|uniref:4-hydroxyphenylacetate 3-monooxygenase oxygenase component n=1 Tax=Raoultella terrigena TaxID=577 RepID=A0A4U9D5C4_RAOTE|nr:4-hydroxyphenylacetate 3-monooxygenase oxygenase component [Raoultella terrigena]
MKPEDFRADAKRPLTGEEYLKSLQDGREIYIYGERVKDVTTHPAFRNAAASVGQLYDALHKPALQDSLCWNTDTGSGGYTHKFFRVAKSADDLRQQRDAIAEWSRLSYGWMGRTPDYKAAFGCALGANRRFTASSNRTPATGTPAFRKPACTLTTPSSTRRSTAISRPMR